MRIKDSVGLDTARGRYGFANDFDTLLRYLFECCLLVVVVEYPMQSFDLILAYYLRGIECLELQIDDIRLFRRARGRFFCPVVLGGKGRFNEADETIV